MMLQGYPGILKVKMSHNMSLVWWKGLIYIFRKVPFIQLLPLQFCFKGLILSQPISLQWILIVSYHLFLAIIIYRASLPNSVFISCFACGLINVSGKITVFHANYQVNSHRGQTCVQTDLNGTTW